MKLILDNLRLRELVSLIHANRPFFDEFLRFLHSEGYATVHEFVHERDDSKAHKVIAAYLTGKGHAKLLDGVSQPYDPAKARWYFLAWLFRDAPAQRLGPLVNAVKGKTVPERRAALLNHVRKFAAPLFPDALSWSWPAVAEVMLARLEGSRRALKGNLIEGIVRRELQELFRENKLRLKVGDKQVRIDEETYDVQVGGRERSVLMPVKTRETMGGGHAMLFSRDIRESVSAARENGYECIPVIIAESWGADLESLGCDKCIRIKSNPNQIAEIAVVLSKKLRDLLPVFRKLE